MRELGIRNGVPFVSIDDRNPALALPADLHDIAIKLQAYAVGDSFPGLTHEEVALLQRKIHPLVRQLECCQRQEQQRH
jgi:hypothetical protein